MRALRTRATAALAVAALALTACGGDGDADEPTTDGDTTEDGGDVGGEAGDVPDGPDIVVASFNFPESTILAEIYAQELEEAGYPVERQLNLGARELIFPQLTGGELGFLPEYLGSALVVGFDEEAPEDVDAGIEALQTAFEADGVTVLDAAPAENANVFVTTSEFADSQGVTTIADLADAGAITFAGPPECEDRETCFRGLSETYGLDQLGFESIQEGAARLSALTSGQVELALFFSTDAILADDALRVLEDPEGIVPPENIVPILRTDIVDAYGDELTALVDDISAQLTTEALIELNTRASEGQAPDAIASDWIAENRG
ncbi:ABC transporter substrate-binding protein [Nitriliruptoraceae bacterium ZYF776]|nr:ABC transporter substrate-binding protein [Profundirhabdus halotolerans]